MLVSLYRPVQHLNAVLVAYLSCCGEHVSNQEGLYGLVLIAGWMSGWSTASLQFLLIEIQSLRH
jgi:hypothetical protein